MLRFLKIAKKGIDMNLIAFHQPTHVYQSDSCPFGLGGYSDKGFAWRFEILEELWFGASNNLLKYVPSIFSPWIDMLAGHLKQSGCDLLMMDSSTSAGWQSTQDQLQGDNRGGCGPRAGKGPHQDGTTSRHPLPHSGYKGILQVVPRREQHCQCSPA